MRLPDGGGCGGGGDGGGAFERRRRPPSHFELIMLAGKIRPEVVVGLTSELLLFCCLSLCFSHLGSLRRIRFRSRNFRR